ncbi:MAG: hypothetical protein IT328_20820 [Caldilineaceae bacterium]|nr:hypothetical protein [Caldilineaceae bacterium]
MPFRESEFIDFNTGTVKIAPMRLAILLPRPLQLADKIRLFQCRIDVWNLGVAVQMLKTIEANEPPSIWSHAAYGLIAIGCSYFEMIGKTLNPSSQKLKTAGTDFNYGFCDVYAEHAPSSGSYDDAHLPLVKEFRDRVHSGIYHLGGTRRGLWIHNEPNISDKDFDVVQKFPADPLRDKYYVNPHSMVRTIVDHFPTFIERLTDPSATYDPMRQKFQEFLSDFREA